ncbi:hypothetical protein ARTHRO9V_160304 [Arthrobacter sp. 9V]|nr:hypothetical protein [Arthrobacter sp. 9V]VXB58550.1 hypothetical protein ARTHRO9V_160304 [Arthrobacter sp. 9V]
MREHDEIVEPPAATDPAPAYADLAGTAPILAGKLARLSPEQLALIFRG